MLVKFRIMIISIREGGGKFNVIKILKFVSVPHVFIFISL